jgi:hypothetical protein
VIYIWGCKRCGQAVKVRARARVLTVEDHGATQLDPSPFTLLVSQAKRLFPNHHEPTFKLAFQDAGHIIISCYLTLLVP